MTVNHHRHAPYIQQAQVLYKAGILSYSPCNILRQVVRIGLPAIATPQGERTPRDEGIIKLVLYFLRNIAVIGPIPNLPSQDMDNEISRSATIESFRQQDVFALLLTICSNMGDDFNLQDVIILEIIFNLIKGVDVEKLWMTEDQRKGQDISDLQHALTVEKGWQKDYKQNGALGWSRHGRFGTMIWIKRDDEKMSAVSGQDNLKDGRHALFNMDRSKKWSKPQQNPKDVTHTIYDFDRTIRLSSSASELLRNFVEEFLDSGFNPLFTHLRKAIEREAERLVDVNYRQFFYSISWFLHAERVRRKKSQQEVKAKSEKLASDFEADSYALVAAVLNQETFIMLNRYMQMSYDNKEWQDLNASMRCFTQILLTVQEMTQSSLDEDQEIAENILNRIFYEETTHDRVVAVLKSYKDQGFGYLDACTELAHVFLKVLEHYSKENIDLQIRSRRKARRKKNAKKQTQNGTEGGENDEEEASENEDIVDVVQVSRERRFDFKRFSAKFISQGSVNTFAAFTAFYRDLNEEQLKRAHRFFYRAAFKQEMAVLLYRVDIIALFYKITKGPEGLDSKHSMFGEWSELVKQILKKMFKKIETRPELVIEMLFSKINATLYYLEYGQEKQTLRDSRPPIDVEIRGAASRDNRDNIGIVVTVLTGDEKSHLVKWITEVLGKAFDERKGWEDAIAARKSCLSNSGDQHGASNEQPDESTEVKASDILIEPSNNEIQAALFRNARLRLLMKLVGFERLGEEDVLGAKWIIPGALSSTQLQEAMEAIKEFSQNPWKGANENETAESIIKRVKISEDREGDDDFIVRRDAFVDDSEGASADEEFTFPDNIRKKGGVKSIAEQIRARRNKRKRSDDEDEVDDEILEARRQARNEAALERRRKIKSELYIQDSDDETDEDRDREFFQREEEGRKRQDERIRMAMQLGSKETKAKTGKRRKVRSKAIDSRRKNVDTASDGDDDLLMVHKDEDTATPSSQPRPHSDHSDLEISDNETPPSSPMSDSETRSSGPGKVLRELTQPRAGLAPASSKAAELVAEGVNSAEDRSDEDDQIISSSAAPARRRVRAGFLFDSDDDE